MNERPLNLGARVGHDRYLGSLPIGREPEGNMAPRGRATGWLGFLLLPSVAFSGCRAEHRCPGREPIVQQLILEAESDTMAVWSDALREGLTSPTAVADAERYVRSRPDRSSYLVLLALRKQSPQVYRALPGTLKARVLCSALASQMSYNDWGVLDPVECRDGLAARALLEVGLPALPELLPLLDSRRGAPLSGSLEASMSRGYRYRACDYAYRYVCLISGVPPMEFDINPDVRDVHIARLKTLLAERERKP